MNGTWSLRTDPQKRGEKLGWQTSAAFAETKGWEPVPVPGYFNNLLPHVGTFLGTVWYRRSVELPADLRGKELLLDLGGVDDLDDTFVNGTKIGHTGEDTEGYWSARRLYPIPASLTKRGRLDIAVKSENLRGNGGITGYARLLVPGKQTERSPFPYTGLHGTYHTESHVRW